MNELIKNIDKLHTTEMGAERIRKNLAIETSEPVLWCKNKIMEEGTIIERKGKNWYITAGNSVITVNAYSYTIITAHRII